MTLSLLPTHEDKPMIDYDPEDSAVKLVDSLHITHEKPISAGRGLKGKLDIVKLEKDVTLDVEVVVNQARQACSCDETARAIISSGPRSSNMDLEICLPCQAREALNSMREVAEQG